MLGLPLVPTEKIDMNAKAAFFPIQILKDPEFNVKLDTFLGDGKPVLITDGLSNHIENVNQFENLHILNVGVDPRNLLRIPREELNQIRNKMLQPFGLGMDAPSMVALYLIGDDLIVLENFRDEAVAVTLDAVFSMKADIKLVLPAAMNIKKEFHENRLRFYEIPPRTLVAIEYQI
jgi:hypothetical protein